MHIEREFLQAVDDHQRIIHKVCNLYVNNEQDRKDLFQEILFNAWKGYANFRQEAKFSTWLYRVALNTAISSYRKDRRQLQTAVLDPDDMMQHEKDGDQQQSAALYKAIETLSPIDKALVMLYMDDYNHQEIGDTLGITANNVAVKMNRIKLRLKESVQKQDIF